MSEPATARLKFPFAANGARIRRARKGKGLSQARLSLAAGTTHRHLIRLEKGEHLPRAELRDRICQACDVERSEIQSADDEEEEPSVPDLLRGLAARLDRTGALT